MEIVCNIYMPISDLDDKERDFFTELLMYKKNVNIEYEKYNNFDFKKNNKYQNMIKLLNYLCLKIDSDNNKKNEYNELTYPNAAYKYIKEKDTYFICVDNSYMRQTIYFGDIIQILPLYKGSNIKVKKSSGVEKIILETTIDNIMNNLKLNYKEYVNKGFEKHIIKFIQRIDIFEKNCICELDLKEYFSLQEVEDCIDLKQ